MLNKIMFLETWEIVFKFHHITVIFFVALLTTALYLTHGNYWKIVKVHNIFKEKHYSIPGCDLSLGRWVYDSTSYPLYKEEQCRFIEGAFACQEYGRKDHKYQNWRWQPHQCNLPRFNATSLLEKIRGKKIVYVGDSLIRNQWESMLCLLVSAIDPSTSIEKFSISIPEYNVTIMKHWSPQLVESNDDDPLHHHGRNKTVRIEAIENHARLWNDADILVFDSYAWWTGPKSTLLWGSFGSPNAIYKKVSTSLRHFEIVMKTWSDWLEFNINRTKTKLFFMSMSPVHNSGEEWGMKKGQNCYGETEPILPGRENWETLIDHNHIAIVKSTLEELGKRGVKIQYVNITQLSAYRKDAHPSIHGVYSKLRWAANKSASPTIYSDCLHWCIPGVPDVWNQFLYAYIMDS